MGDVEGMKREPNLDMEPIQERLAAITPGQWVNDGDYEIRIASTPRDVRLFAMEDYMASGKDAEFIARAPDDIRALIAEVKMLRGTDDMTPAAIYIRVHRWWETAGLWCAAFAYHPDLSRLEATLEHAMEYAESYKLRLEQNMEQDKPDHPLGTIETTPVELPDIKAALKPDERDPNGRESAPEADDQVTPDPSLVKKLPSFIDPPGFTEKYPAVPMESVDVYAAQQRKGHFSVSYDLWCGMCPGWAHMSTLDAEDAAIEAVHVGWTKTKTRGWCCPDHKIRPGT